MSKREQAATIFLGIGSGLILGFSVLRFVFGIDLPGVLIAGTVCLMVSAVTGGLS